MMDFSPMGGLLVAGVAQNHASIVEGVQMIKRHMRKSQEHPQGAIVEREGTVHLSNVMKAGQFDARSAKRGGTTAPAGTE